MPNLEEPSEDAVYAVAVLIDELKTEDVQQRLNSVRGLSTIALVLGAERTRAELIPFLNDSVDDEDEVLLALAEELGGFVEYVGGVAHAPVILPLLESIASAEETVVRDKTVESLCKICEQLSAEQANEHFIPIIQRLTVGEWFTSRVSACGLFSTVYPKATPQNQTLLRGQFTQLCSDDTPMVRRAACNNLGKFALVLDKADVKNELMASFTKLAKDDQDSVRLLSVTNCVDIAKSLPKEDHASIIIPLVNQCAKDKSWRVRYMFAEKIVEIAEIVGKELAQPNLLLSFTNIMKDSEAEVRAAAASRVTAFAKLVDVDAVARSIFPVVRDLAGDPIQHVRAALGSVIMGLAPVLGKQLTIDHLLPLFLKLLKDDFPDVRLNIIFTLDDINQVIGIDLLSQSLLPAVVELASDPQWRVRKAIIQYVPLLAKQLGLEFFDDKLGDLSLRWLTDCVASIREAACENLFKLSEVFGTQWAETKVLPRLSNLYNHQNYLYRQTALFAVSRIAPALTPDVVANSLLAIILRMATDAVPNIRFNVSKVLGDVGQMLDAGIVSSMIRPTLTSLAEDPDKDVKHFALLSLQNL